MTELTERQRKYREVYLRSEHWQDVRREALALADHKCTVCNGAERLDVHHRSYAHLGHEDVQRDVTVLCRACHKLFHRTGRLVPGPLTVEPADWLPGHGDVEVAAAPARRTLPQDEWIAGTF